MTQKERLANLLDEFWLEHFDSCNTDAMTEHLLSNGVIVPPCKVGDTVYIINKNGTCPMLTSIANVYYDGQTLGYNVDDDVFCDFDENDIGHAVFKTYKEAEQALKERDEGCQKLK